MKTFKLLSIVIFTGCIAVLSLYSQNDTIINNGKLLDSSVHDPNDANYDPYSITIWFQDEVISQDYLCDYWENNPDGSGSYPVNPDLLIDNELYNALLNLTANRMRQYTNWSPCKDTLSITRYGDTIETPHFWNSYYITFDSAWAEKAVNTIKVMRGVVFVELNARAYPDSSGNGKEEDTLISNVNSIDASKQRINVFCEQKDIIVTPYLRIHYTMNKPSPVTIQIFDILGNMVAEKCCDYESGQTEQVSSVEFDGYPAGFYFIVVKSNNAAGYSKFRVVR